MDEAILYKRYAKILKAKGNRKGRVKDPLDYVIRKSFNAFDLLKLIHEKVKTKKLIQEARKQFIITSVTSIEVLLREYFVYLLNFEVISEKFTEQINKKEFSIEDMNFIKKKGISNSELISDSYNFQNISQINDAFSKALSVNFFKELKEYKFWFDKKNKKEGFFVLGDFYEDLEWLINSRHEFVHDINEEVRLSKKGVEDIDTFCISFISQLGFYMSDKIKQLKKTKS